MDVVVPKLKIIDGQTCPTAFQRALDTIEVAGSWDWDIPSDLVRADTFVALLFNVDPGEASGPCRKPYRRPQERREPPRFQISLTC